MSKPEHDRTIDYIEFGATDIEATKRFYAAYELAIWSVTPQNRAEAGGP